MSDKNKKDGRMINEIIIHCSATVEGANYTVHDIDKWHRAKHWNGCGYHYVIHLDGEIKEGRDVEIAGAHCKGHNAHSIGVCYIGGLDAVSKPKPIPKDTRTPAQKAALIMLLRTLHKKHPDATVHGHNEFANKACPSFNVHDDKDIMEIFEP